MILHQFLGGGSEHKALLEELGELHRGAPEPKLRRARGDHLEGKLAEADGDARLVGANTTPGQSAWQEARLRRAEIARDRGEVEVAVTWLQDLLERTADPLRRLVHAEYARALADARHLEEASLQIAALQALPLWR